MKGKQAISISLIIPVYKVSAYIERCLKSVIKQTYNYFECILVDDASPDDSIAKCERIIADYDGPIQFRILHHQQNRGLSAARNTGTDAAMGDYILFIDSDDIISNDCVEKLMAPVLKDHTIEMVFGGSIKFSDNGLITLPYNFKLEREEYTTNEAVRYFYFNPKHHYVVAAWNKLISKSFFDNHQLKFKEGQLWEDVLLTFYVMKYLKHLVSIPDITYFYYIRPDSITNGTNMEEVYRQRTRLGEIISANFTPGDEAREAACYFSGFCKNYMRIPKSESLKNTARRFRKALPFRKYPIERTLLVAANVLPHNQTGKEIFKFLQKQLFRLREKRNNRHRSLHSPLAIDSLVLE